MVQRKASAVWLLAFIAAALVSACGGGGGGGGSGSSSAPINYYTVSGTISGLTGTGLALQNNGGSNLAISANGAFTFATKVANGANYTVTVSTQPTGPVQTCTVNSGTGTISGANITNVSVVCSTNAYTVSGTVSGLTGTGLVLQDNGGSNLAISANGAFTFATPVASGANFNVTVLTQPSGPTQTCTVNSGTGLVTNANITGITVTCSTNTYTVSGIVSGLSGAGFVLQNNGGNNLSIAANGAFTFTAPVVSGATYTITVFAQPSGPTQTCTVGNFTGTVINANITNVTVTCATNSYTIGGTVTGLAGTGLVLQDNGGDFLSIAANGTFTFATPVASGAAYSVAVKTQPTLLSQTCTVIGGTGAVGGANITSVAVNCVTPFPRYAFVVNSADNSVSSYVVDAATGRLKYIGKAATGLNPQAIALDPTGKYAYVINASGNTVSQYTIGANGTLTPMVAPTVAAGTQPIFIAIDPTGKYAYVANSLGASVSQYSIGAGGALTPMATPTVAAGNMPWSVAVDTSSLYVYVANRNGGISQYTIGAGGALTPMATPTVTAPVSPASIAVDPSGKYVYVSDCGAGGTPTSGAVYQYTIGAGGALTPMTTPTVATGQNPMSLAVDPSGKYVYVASAPGNTLSQYAIGAGGGLVPMATATIATGTSPFGVTVDSSGKYVYAANANGNSISQYTIGAGGALAPNAPATAVALTAPMAIAMTSGLAPVQAVPQYAYTVNSIVSSISQFTIGAGGSLAPMVTPTVATGFSPLSFAVDPAGKYAYVVNAGTSVSQYAIGVSGALTPVTTVTAGNLPQYVTVDPSGRYAYTANFGSNDVTQYTIGAGGGLTPMAASSVAAGTGPASVTVDPTGQYAYVTNSNGSSVSQYTIGAGGGLVPMAASSVAVVNGPRTIAIDSSGQHAYVANGANQIYQFTIGVGGGLIPMATPTVTISGLFPSLVAIDPTNKYAYVASYNGNNLSQYTIGAGGGLIPMATPTVATGVGPESVAVDPSGKYAYVADYNGGMVSQYTIGAGGGLIPMATPTVSAGPYPFQIVTTGTWQ